jgi:hypothetical protein
MVPAETCCELPLLLYDGVDVADVDVADVVVADVADVADVVITDADPVIDEGPVGIEVAEYMFINQAPPQASSLLPAQGVLQPVGFGRPGF